MKLIKKIVIGLLTLSIGGTSLLAVEQNLDINSLTLTSEVTNRANVKIKEYPYEHIELKEVENLIQELRDIVAKDDQKAYYTWDKAYFDLYSKTHTMSQLAYLRYQRFNNEEKYFDEYLYNLDLLGKMKSSYVEIMNKEDDKESEKVTRLYELNIERTKLVDDYLLKETTTTIDVNGKKMTAEQLFGDDALSVEQLYALYDQWYTKYTEEVGQILLDLIKVDNETAKLQGYDAYIDYAYDNFYRDYTPNEAKQYIANVKELIPSVYSKLHRKNITTGTKLMKYDFQDEATLFKNFEEGLLTTYPELKPAYDYMRTYNLYDVEERNNKSTGAFTTYFDFLGEPFLFMNYALPYDTALTLIHEFGHFYSYYEIGVNNGGLDLDETYSQAMELLAFKTYDKMFQNEELSEAAQIYILTNIVSAVIQGCLYDEFLRQVYQNPDITVEEMNTLYADLAKSYGFNVDGRSWTNISHNFQSPFYYTSYSVSAIVALEMWIKDLQDNTAGMKIYSNLIQSGKNHGFMDTLNAAGLSNPLLKSTVQEIATAVSDFVG